MEMQKRMSDSKYKHSIFIVSIIQINLPFSGKELCSDTNEIQQTHRVQFD